MDKASPIFIAKMTFLGSERPISHALLAKSSKSFQYFIKLKHVHLLSALKLPKREFSMPQQTAEHYKLASKNLKTISEENNKHNLLVYIWQKENASVLRKEKRRKNLTSESDSLLEQTSLFTT